ncbi:homing endonuclease protein [Rhizobium phage RHph_TM40]|uniref:Homing endonuclease protein n=1 Tax=Rhizobium phage RHph_TM30 TaxID=2509764 RepID=A0A7S5R5B0_9CAUD|nr:homing endonuclease protein [Rhizobium phage RHph_TM30]QIG71387.1 homing endonuclease protein [Rhizobium phage RHph_TM30]QIG71751.1 homing endonuclease protein [Rhizobium phage RHph_TM40]QIG72112.1 homing endonuclease protein [Rhizobium phage RHph_TM2_3B]QIG72474.1 homing endonuclease protein [Rhizobium phage RHph_TM3_3_6]
MKCSYCETEFRHLSRHVRYCPQNPDRIVKLNQFSKAESLGLPKPPLSEKSRRMTTERNASRVWTPEIRSKLSKSMIKYFKDNPEAHPYLKYHSSGESYAEGFFREFFLSHDLSFKQELQVGLYTLDFAFEDKMIDVEINGNFHYNNPGIVEKDQRRRLFLEERGWTIIEVRWSEYKKMNESERSDYLNSLLSQLS